MDLNRCNVVLDIQELVLVDLPASNPQALKQTVTAELTRLFQVQGIPSALAQTSQQIHMPAGSLAVSGTYPLGIEIAQAIYRGLGG